MVCFLAGSSGSFVGSEAENVVASISENNRLVEFQADGSEKPPPALSSHEQLIAAQKDVDEPDLAAGADKSSYFSAFAVADADRRAKKCWRQRLHAAST